MASPAGLVCVLFYPLLLRVQEVVILVQKVVLVQALISALSRALPGGTLAEAGVPNIEA